MQYHRNQSTLAYDNGEGGGYIEATIYLWGVSDEQLFNAATRCLNDRLRNDPGMKWPPTIAELENDKGKNLL